MEPALRLLRRLAKTTCVLPEFSLVMLTCSLQTFFFGHLTEEIEDLRHAHRYGDLKIPQTLQDSFDAIRQGVFGDPAPFQPLIDSIINGKDYYCITDDFESFLQAQQMIDEAYSEKKEWTKKTILSTARMGHFSSDRCVMQYAEEIWSVEQLKVPSHISELK